MIRNLVIGPINTDKQADKAARRLLLSDRRLSKIDANEDAQLARLHIQISRVRQKAAAERARIEQIRRPLREQLIRLASDHGGRHRSAGPSRAVRIKDGMRIIGIDPGTGILGFGVIESKNGKNQLVDAGVIRTLVKQDDAVRLQTIYEEISDIIAQTKPTEMSVEKLFFAQNVTTAMTVAQARGVVLLAGMQAGLVIGEYTPLQIKQALTGYGRAEKKQMQEMVRVILGLKDVPQPDDCADALAAALTHAAQVKVK